LPPFSAGGQVDLGSEPAERPSFGQRYGPWQDRRRHPDSRQLVSWASTQGMPLKF